MAPAETVDDAASLFTALELEPGYAKVAVDYPSAQISVLWKGPTPNSLARAVELARGMGVAVVIGEAPFSEQDVADAAKKILEEYPGDVTAVFPNGDRTGLVVEVMPRTPASRLESARVQEAAAFSKAGGIPAQVLVGPGKVRQLSRQNMGSPFKGGGATATASGEDYCSTGFAATMPDGTGRLISAFHCDDLGLTVRDGVGDVIGPVSNHRASLDAELIDPNASPATTGKVYVGPWTSATLKSVAGDGAPAEGQIVCTSGAVTGEHCGLTVSATGVSWTCNGTVCSGFASRYSDLGAAVGGGDSGGPVYASRSDGRVGARGMISGGTGERQCGPTSVPTTCYAYVYSVAITRILDNWNATIETEP